MSNDSSSTTSDCDIQQGCDAIDIIIQPRDKDLGGFSVRRTLPTQARKMVGPWIFFDHMGPADFAAGKGISVRPHPHINLATVTYLFEGDRREVRLATVQKALEGLLDLMNNTNKV